MKQVYGSSIHPPPRNGISLYKRYAGMASSCRQQELHSSSSSSSSNGGGVYRRLMLVPKSAFSVDNTLQVTPPYVTSASLDIYKDYVDRGVKMAVTTSVSDSNLYRRYALHWLWTCIQCYVNTNSNLSKFNWNKTNLLNNLYIFQHFLCEGQSPHDDRVAH